MKTLLGGDNSAKGFCVPCQLRPTLKRILDQLKNSDNLFKSKDACLSKHPLNVTCPVSDPRNLFRIFALYLQRWSTDLTDVKTPHSRGVWRSASSCLLSCPPSSFLIESYSKPREFAPREQILSLKGRY